MNLKQRLVRKMMDGLPPEEQVLMTTDFLNWFFLDYPQTERLKKLAFWTPRLTEDMSEGVYGLWLLIFHYTKYLVSLRWLRYWFHPMKAPREDHISR